MRIGLDLGGTKISALALAAGGVELARQRLPTPADYTGIIAACVTLVRGLEQKTGQQGSVGVGAPGVVDSQAGIIRFCPNIAALAGKPLVADLAAALARPVRLANDAGCFALSEAGDGAGRDARLVYGVILGTGVGGALVVHKTLHQGANAVQEWGHVPLPWPDATDIPTRCGCGRLGDIESYLSGTALHRQLQEKLGKPCPISALQQGIAAGNPLMLAVLETYTRRLAKALAMLITLLDPDMVVLGGGVSNLSFITQTLPRHLPHYTLTPQPKTQIAQARHGDDSGLRGAAWLWAEAADR